MGLRYKGFTAVQSAVNHHVMIFRANKFMAEFQCTRKFTDDELRNLIDWHVNQESRAKARNANDIYYGEKIRKARRAKRITIIKMAKSLDWSLSHYCDIECGYITAREEEREKIKKELGL
jgi:ribosome-binding protein aMBF1 (putative translation factor)